MNPEDFKASSPGVLERVERNVYAFVPNGLPPKINYDDKLIRLISEAERALGDLSGTGRILPNPYFLIGPYIRREAVLSSQIEGTQASISDLYFFEANDKERSATSDVKEVRNYVTAMEYGQKRLKKLPLSTRLVQEIHRVLMAGVRGGQSDPGSFRRRQNWIGSRGCTIQDATYVPPPHNKVKDLLSSWEAYLHSEAAESVLVQCALMHYQFEAIHPFLDGNGRVGRLLITFFLCERKALSQPLLYLSGYFNRYRSEYYARLLEVSREGDWLAWLTFFLTGVKVQSENAVRDARKILDLHETYKNKLNDTKKVPESAHRLIDEIFINPVVSTSKLAKKWSVPYNSVKNGIGRLTDIGILVELPVGKRKKLYVSEELMSLFSPM